MNQSDLECSSLAMACEETFNVNVPHVVESLTERDNILVGRLGTGSQGEVWRACNRSTGAMSAVKLLKMTEDAQNELRVYRHLSRLHPHPNVISLSYSFMDQCVTTHNILVTCARTLTLLASHPLS